jgi:plasmid stabilization system protein ParE
MRHRVVFTPRALRQLDELYRYITEQSGEARADNYVQRIVAFCQALETLPQRGTKRDDVRRGLRVISYKKRLQIVFSIEDDRVVIHGAFYGGQDYAASLQDDGSESEG